MVQQLSLTTNHHIVCTNASLSNQTRRLLESMHMGNRALVIVFLVGANLWRYGIDLFAVEYFVDDRTIRKTDLAGAEVEVGKGVFAPMLLNRLLLLTLYPLGVVVLVHAS